MSRSKRLFRASVHSLFHEPNGEYEYNLRTADCKWSAMAEGWHRLLKARERQAGRTDVMSHNRAVSGPCGPEWMEYNLVGNILR